MGVDVVAAGSGVGSVVVVGEGDAWRPEALGARSKVDSLVGSCSWPAPSSAMLSPASSSLSLFLFKGLVSTSSTERARKADCSPSSGSSTTSTGPCKGTEGTALGPGPGSSGASIAGASGTVLASVSSFFVSIFALLASDRSRRTGCTARGCCRCAETVCLLLPEGFIVFSALCFCCASPSACCWCRVPAACF